MTSREVFEYRERRRCGHGRDFLTVGGMGHASQIALGIALQRPDRQIFCVDGDGAVLMHMGSLAINGTAACPNFNHIVINNGVHESVGGQPTVGFRIDLQSVASAMGYAYVSRATTPAAVRHAVRVLRQSPAGGFVEIRVKPGHREDLGRPTKTPIENKEQFMEFLAS